MDPLDRLDEGLVRMRQRATYDERNRITLLLVHGVVAVAIGVAMLVDRPPDAWPFQPWTLGAPPIAGGLLLLFGLLAGRILAVEAVGMAVLLLWDTALVVTFVHAIRATPDAATYPVFVYLGYALLMGVHLVTLAAYVLRKREP